MPDIEIKLLLYNLMRQLDQAQTERQKIVDKHRQKITPEVKEQLDKLDKLIDSFQAQIKFLL